MDTISPCVHVTSSSTCREKKRKWESSESLLMIRTLDPHGGPQPHLHLIISQRSHFKYHRIGTCGGYKHSVHSSLSEPRYLIHVTISKVATYFIKAYKLKVKKRVSKTWTNHESDTVALLSCSFGSLGPPALNETEFCKDVNTRIWGSLEFM